MFPLLHLTTMARGLTLGVVQRLGAGQFLKRKKMLNFVDIFPEKDNDYNRYKVHFAIGHAVKKEPLIALSKNKFKEWQEYQNNKNFERDYIVSLVYYKTDEWIFAGLYKRIDVIKKYDSSRNKEYYWYTTELLDIQRDLIGRAVFSFEKKFRQSYVFLEKHYKKILLKELLGKPYRIAEFPGYENVILSFEELKEIMVDEEVTWRTALSSIKGIYLITDTNNGKHYVGSAYGDEAFWNRWVCYSNTGHGNNIELRKIIVKHGIDYAKNFQFSILEIRSKITDDDEIIRRETHWKRVIRTKEFGYNAN